MLPTNSIRHIPIVDIKMDHEEEPMDILLAINPLSHRKVIDAIERARNASNTNVIRHL